MNGKSARSAAARAASRINGARGCGPRSAAGKQVSSRNALRHGLFRARAGNLEDMSAEVAVLASQLNDYAMAGLQAATFVEAAVSAAIQLEQARALVRQVRGQIEELLVSVSLDNDLFALRTDELLRFGRYERRFRGRRDRALRKLMALAARKP